MQLRSWIISLLCFGTLLFSGCASSHRPYKQVVGFSGARFKVDKVTAGSGGSTKYWRWPKYWELLHEDGSLARQWRSPHGTEDKSKADMGPELVLARDHNNNIAYSISYWQRTVRVLDVPITISFYERENAGTLLFKVIFDDETAAGCQNQVVKKGPTNVALHDPQLFDKAEWIGVTLPVVTTRNC